MSSDDRLRASAELPGSDPLMGLLDRFATAHAQSAQALGELAEINRGLLESSQRQEVLSREVLNHLQEDREFLVGLRGALDAQHATIGDLSRPWFVRLWDEIKGNLLAVVTLIALIVLAILALTGGPLQVTAKPGEGVLIESFRHEHPHGSPDPKPVRGE